MIVDDHPLFRLGLADLINAEQDLASCCEASSSPGALRMMRMCPPDAAIVDISLPGINGIELIKIVKAGASRRCLGISYQVPGSRRRS